MTPATRLRGLQAPALMAVLTALAIILLARGLPVHTWVAGDSGVKLVATRNVLRHPEAPLQIPLPVVGGRPVPLVEPFFRLHGDHSHAVTPEAFVLASAPFLRWFGFRGLYVLPAAGAVLAVLAWVWIGRRLSPSTSPWLVWLVALVGTPWLFYGLEFWEHAPAIGAASLGTALFLRGGRSAEPWVLAAAGACFGVAALLRPESVWYAAATVLAFGWRQPHPVRAFVLAASAAALCLVPWAVFTYAHFATLASPHLGGLSGLFQPGWWATRLFLADHWFFTSSTTNAWRVAPLLLLGFVPSARVGAGWRPGLLFISAATMLGVWLTAPNDGGAQWGPRYLLLAYGPFVVLVAAVLQDLWRKPRVGPALVVIALLASAWVQRDGYRDLKGSKETYAQMVEFIRRANTGEGVVVTDLWWLDQVAASLDRVTFLFTPTAAAAEDALNQLTAARVARVTLVSGAESPTLTTVVPTHSCYQVTTESRHTERGLIARTLEFSCSPR